MNIIEFKDKEQITDKVFLVREKNKNVGKNLKTYMMIILSDASGQIDARVWDNVDQIEDLFEIGDLVKVKGAVQIYNQRKQFVIHKLEKVSDTQLDPNNFKKPEVKLDGEALYLELLEYVYKIQSPYIQQLCLDSVKDPEIKKRLIDQPAAKSIHHARRSGLVQHIVAIMKLMESMSRLYPYLNYDLLLFGALFHDIGKIHELAVDAQGRTYYTNEGQLLGHMLLACELVEKKSQKILGFPEDLRVILKHIILSHHGKIEYGSPKLPQIMEAYVVAQIDELDSKMDQIFGFVQNERETGESWSKYHENLERYFYLENLKGKWL
jgi:3'-5' exoribonuclease